MTTQPIHENAPRAGFYRLKYKGDARWRPVAIWSKDGALVCRVGKDMADPFQIWTWAADNPVSAADAKFAFSHGYWPNEPAPRTDQLSNLPSDPYQRLMALVDQQTARVAEWHKAHPTVASQTDADYAKHLEVELNDLEKEADRLHKAEKDPILVAGKKVDDKFRFRAALKDWKATLRRVYGSFMAREEARLKAVAQAQWEAEQARLKAEREAQKIDDPIAYHTSSEPELPLGPEPVKVSAGGGIGKRAGLKDVWIGTVTDYREAAMFFIDHPKLREVIDSLVSHQVRDLKATAKIPGVEIRKERQAA